MIQALPCLIPFSRMFQLTDKVYGAATTILLSCRHIHAISLKQFLYLFDSAQVKTRPPPPPPAPPPIPAMFQVMQTHTRSRVESHMSTKALTRIRAQEVDLGGKFLQRIEIRMITFRVFQKSFSCLSGCGCRCNLSATYGHTFRVGRMRQTKARREMNAIL